MKFFRVISFFVLLAIFSACKPKVPKQYLQPDEFEDILYDYHLADAMAENAGTDGDASYDAVLYRQAVFRKYGITQAEFDSSLVYYMRHADKFHKVYENLAERFENEAMALGASANDIRRYGDMKSASDTTNMWVGVPSAMFMPVAPYNVMSFELPADSTYHEGDRLILSFNCNFLDRGSSRYGVALLALQFKNDSVASNTVRMSGNSNYSVTVADGAGKGIKAVRGFFYLGENSRREDSDRGINLMFVNNIRLVRMRGSVAKPTGSVSPLRPAVPDTSLKKSPDKVQGGNAPMERRLVPVKGGVAPMKVNNLKPVRNVQANRPEPK